MTVEVHERGNSSSDVHFSFHCDAMTLWMMLSLFYFKLIMDNAGYLKWNSKGSFVEVFNKIKWMFEKTSKQMATSPKWKNVDRHLVRYWKRVPNGMCNLFHVQCSFTWLLSVRKIHIAILLAFKCEPNCIEYKSNW